MKGLVRHDEVTESGRLAGRPVCTSESVGGGTLCSEVVCRVCHGAEWHVWVATSCSHSSVCSGRSGAGTSVTSGSRGFHESRGNKMLRWHRTATGTLVWTLGTVASGTGYCCLEEKQNLWCWFFLFWIWNSFLYGEKVSGICYCSSVKNCSFCYRLLFCEKL
jgi:hypothetical protein